MDSLLFDANISFKIKRLLKDTFAELYHVGDFSKKNIPDTQIWQLAKEKSLVIVTYDEDFIDIQTLKGFPPKIVWLRFGNQPTVYIANKILLYESQIKQFIGSEELGVIEIY